MRPTLIIRGLIGLWFGVRLALLPAGGWEHTYDVLADYLVLDGLAALVVSATLVREGARVHAKRERALGAMLLVDGACRAASGGAIHLLPGIPGFPVTAVIFVALMFAGTAAIGFVEAVLTAREEYERHGRSHARAQLAAMPVALASALSIGFGLAGLRWMGEPLVFRRLLAPYIIATSCIMFGLALARQAGSTRADRRRQEAL